MRHYNGSESCGFVFTPVNTTLFSGYDVVGYHAQQGYHAQGYHAVVYTFTPRLPYRQATTLVHFNR